MEYLLVIAVGVVLLALILLLGGQVPRVGGPGVIPFGDNRGQKGLDAYEAERALRQEPPRERD